MTDPLTPEQERAPTMTADKTKAASLVWLTDIHLNFIRDRCVEFGKQVAEEIEEFENPHVVITGDIAEFGSFLPLFSLFVAGLNWDYLQGKKPLTRVHFNLGNHDAYGGSIEESKRQARIMGKLDPGKSAEWLNGSIVRLTDDAVLTGHDGWYDGQFGLPSRSNVILADFHFIDELKDTPAPYRSNTRLPRPTLLKILRKLGAASATEAGKTLREAAKTYKKIFFATHVPPFKEACWHEGKMSDSNWLPWFTNKAMGDMLLEVAQEHPDVYFHVLCGHTHGEGEVQMLPNLEVSTGAATYGSPKIHKIIDV